MPSRIKATSHKRIWIIACAVLVVVLVGVVYKESTKPKAVSGPIKTIHTKTTDSTANKSTTSQQPQDTTDSQKTATVSQSSTNGDLVAPYGTLVSNHHPGQNGSNLTELSQCTTTPGASCYIKFTQDGVVKTLSNTVTDSNGAASWEWNVEDAGLTSGSWTITAVATLSGQTKTTTDQLTLEIQ